MKEGEVRLRLWARAVLAGALGLVVAGGPGLLWAGSATSLPPRYVGHWSQAELHPLGNDASAVAYDTAHHELVAWATAAGVQPPYYTPTSRLYVLADGSHQWTQIPVPEVAPGTGLDTCCTGLRFDNSYAPNLTFDPQAGGVVAVGHTLDEQLCAQVWNGSAWTQPSCSGALFCPSCYDQFLLRATAFDGVRSALLVVGDDNGVRAMTEEWRGGAWGEVRSKHQPGPLLVPVPNCVDNVDPTGCDPLGFDGTDPAPHPGGAAWDPASRCVVLLRADGVTWTWNGQDWKQSSAVQGASSTSTAAFDPAIGTVVSYESPHVTGWWNGKAWVPMATTGSPPDGGVITYDPALHGVVLLSAIPATLWVLTPVAVTTPSP